MTDWMVWVMDTMSPELISASSWAAVGRGLLMPGFELSRVITPAVEEGLPKEFALLPREVAPD